MKLKKWFNSRWLPLFVFFLAILYIGLNSSVQVYMATIIASVTFMLYGSMDVDEPLFVRGGRG